MWEEEIAHDLATHLYADRDGGFIEGTGRKPLRFRATIPFLNGTLRGSDLFKFPLYPDQYEACRTAAALRGTGTLRTPTGPVQAKLESWKTTSQAEKNRDGVIVEASWVESTDTAEDSDSLFSQPSPISEAINAADEIDTSLATHAVNAHLVQLPTYKTTFADTMRSFQAIGDSISRQAAKVSGGGQLGTILYRLKNIEASLNASPRPSNWPLLQSISRMRSAIYDIKKTIETPKRPVSVHTTERETTLSTLASELGTPIADMFNLNPAALSKPTVAKGTRIRFYKK